eukprot:10105825-Alexandrium_andersonii.AAC.1
MCIRDSNWVNPICDVLGQPRAGGEEPPLGVSSTLGLSGGVIAEDGEVRVPLVSNLPTRYTHFGYAAVYPDQHS